MFQRKIFTLLLCFLLIGQGLAQTKTADPKRPEISDELKGKANALLLVLAREAEQFQLPDNRITARILVADLLWESNEKEARQLFQNAVGETEKLVGELLFTEEIPEDEVYMRLYHTGELRKTLLLQIAAHDPAFALSAFQTLSPAKETGEPLFEGDEVLELELAKNIAVNDPKRSFEMAMKNLESGLGFGVFETLEGIYKKDQELGAKLAREILKKIKDQVSNASVTGTPSANTNTSANTSATPSPNAPTEITVYQIKEFVDKVKVLNRNTAKDKKPTVLTDSEYKELIEILARKYSTQQYLSTYEVASVMSDIDALFPALAQAIRQKLANEKASLDQLVRDSSFEAEMSDKTIEEVIQIIEKKPVAQRDALYMKAAETVYNEGDIITAKQLYGKVKTKPEYDYLGEQIEVGIPLAMAKEGNLEEVRGLIANAGTPEEKIEILTTLAQSVAAKGNLKAAKELTEEARATYLGKMKNRRNMTSVMQMSQAYAVVEPAQGFSFLENNISFINSLIAAGIIVDEFNEYGSIKDDEVLLSVVQMESYRNMPKGVVLIRNLAGADFQRTVSLADSFARREAGFYARFRIIQALLDPKAEETEEAMQKQLYEGEGC